MAPKRSDERGEVAQCVASLFFWGGRGDYKWAIVSYFNRCAQYFEQNVLLIAKNVLYLRHLNESSA